MIKLTAKKTKSEIVPNWHDIMNKTQVKSCAVQWIAKLPTVINTSHILTTAQLSALTQSEYIQAFTLCDSAVIYVPLST